MPILNSFQEKGFTYYELYNNCPVCFERGKLRPQNYWTHGDAICADGRIYIGDNAHYYCNKCKISEHVINWSYYCPGHSNVQFETLSNARTESPECVGLAAQMAGFAGVAWLKRFLDNLDD